MQMDSDSGMWASMLRSILNEEDVTYKTRMELAHKVFQLSVVSRATSFVQEIEEKAKLNLLARHADREMYVKKRKNIHYTVTLLVVFSHHPMLCDPGVYSGEKTETTTVRVNISSKKLWIRKCLGPRNCWAKLQLRPRFTKCQKTKTLSSSSDSSVLTQPSQYTPALKYELRPTQILLLGISLAACLIAL